mgnify:CR=1 FL=1
MLRLEPTYEGLKPGVGLRSLVLRSRLEPTYEGLKRKQLRSQGGLRSASLEPTYEGLKLTSRPVACMSLRRLEPTYEGLKHPSRRGGRGPENREVWSLPMRD